MVLGQQQEACWKKFKLDLYITSWYASMHSKWIKDLQVKKMKPETLQLSPGRISL